MVELVSPFSSAGHETHRFQDFEVLGDGLPGQPQVAPHCQPGADLEEGLTVSVDQFIENRPPGRRCERLKKITHKENVRQVVTCLSNAAEAFRTC